jgi:hypothetical protein
MALKLMEDQADFFIFSKLKTVLRRGRCQDVKGIQMAITA